VIDEIFAGDAMPEIKSVASMHIIRRKHSFHFHAAIPLRSKQPRESAEAADFRDPNHAIRSTPI
jgi:hypothetical protein